MLNYSNAITEKKSYSGLQISAVNLSLLVNVFASAGNIKFSDLPTADKNSLFFPLTISFIIGLTSLICNPE